jgi:hypothetical protein
MERFIGQSCTVCVMGPSGKRLGHHVVESNGKALVERIRSIAGERHVCLEEGTQSEWLYEILQPHAKRVVVTQPLRRGGQQERRDRRVGAGGPAAKRRAGAQRVQVAAFR